jgi:hypothetical protein
LGGASVIAAPTDAWAQYSVIAPGAGFVSTERTNVLGSGWAADLRGGRGHDLQVRGKALLPKYMASIGVGTTIVNHVQNEALVVVQRGVQ